MMMMYVRACAKIFKSIAIQTRYPQHIAHQNIAVNGRKMIHRACHSSITSGCLVMGEQKRPPLNLIKK